MSDQTAQVSESGFRRRSRHGCIWRPDWLRPHVSAWAIWSRLCDINAFTQRDARTVLETVGLHTSVFKAQSDHAWLLEASDLTAEGREQACAAGRGFAPAAVAATHVRYCPTCLAAGYHAACFQHLALTRCPIHNVALCSKCASCGRRVRATYEAARAVPFGCGACGSALVARRGMQPLELSIVMSAIGSTTRALHQNEAAANHTLTIRLGKRDDPAHATWWDDIDPFVSGSTWRPQCARFAADSDPKYPSPVLDAAAWTVLVQFVQGMMPSVKSPQAVFRAADAFERRNPCGVPTEPLPAMAVALAALIARFGGVAVFSRASRLMGRAVAASFFPLTPQESDVVCSSTAANSAVFEAEVQGEYVRMLKLARRNLASNLCRTNLSADPTHVHWRWNATGAGTGTLQWRGMHRARFLSLTTLRSEPHS